MTLKVAEKQATYGDYLKTPEGAAYQLIDGELIMTPAPSPFHQWVSRRIAFAMQNFVEKHSLGEIFYSPNKKGYDVRVRSLGISGMPQSLS